MVKYLWATGMKKKNLFYIILIVIVALACLWAFISASYITKNFKKKLLNDSLGKQEISIQNLLVTETKEDKKSWELFADNGYYDNAAQVAILNNIVGNFYDDNEVVASFESSKGTYNQKTKQIVLYERTLIVYKDGSNVSANKMEWQGKDSDITAEGSVRLELPSKVVVVAEKAALSSDFKHLTVLGRTKTEIYDNGNMGITK